MGIADKARHKAQEVVGRAKAKTGELTGDGELEAEGRAQQAGGSVEQAGDAVKDAASDVGDAVRRDRS
jgi:uncharacterized protein YjbJ (UPF0337 family)